MKASHFTTEKFAKEGKRNLRGERLAAENSEETEDLADKDQPARKVIAVETRGERTLQQRSTNQHEWLTVETPEERELRLEC